MRISDWSSDVCSSDLKAPHVGADSAASFCFPEGSRLKPLPQGFWRPIGYPCVPFHRSRPVRRRIVAGNWKLHGSRAFAPELLGGLAAGLPIDRKSGVAGKSWSVRVILGGRRIINKKKKTRRTPKER